MSIPWAHATCEQKRARDHGSRNTRSNLVSIHCRLTTASASKTFGEERVPERGFQHVRWISKHLSYLQSTVFRGLAFVPVDPNHLVRLVNEVLFPIRSLGSWSMLWHFKTAGNPSLKLRFR